MKTNFKQWIGQLRRCIERRRQRRQLLQLGGHMLRDIGVSHVDALHEASKPCWRR